MESASRPLARRWKHSSEVRSSTQIPNIPREAIAITFVSALSRISTQAFLIWTTFYCETIAEQTANLFLCEKQQPLKPYRPLKSLPDLIEPELYQFLLTL